jgi:hypothetical protein
MIQNINAITTTTTSTPTQIPALKISPMTLHPVKVNNRNTKVSEFKILFFITKIVYFKISVEKRISSLTLLNKNDAKKP